MSDSGSVRVKLAPLVERLRQARRVLVFTHQRPDTDALGSQAAMAWILAALGATEIHLIQFGDAPGPYRFLQENLPAKITLWREAWGRDAGTMMDTIVVVDTCTYQQLEPAQAFLQAQRARVVGFDHHLSREAIGPEEQLYADTSAAACVEILWQLAREAGVAMDARLALPLMAGLVGDTGWFRFDSVTRLTHEMAADLAPFIDPSELYERLMQNETKAKLGLMQRALAGVRWSCADQFACMLLRNSDFVETGATQSQTEYLVDMPMTVQTVEVVALMTEMADGKVRVSLRSKHHVDVNKICNGFGGGGHAKAAGCRLDGSLEAAYGKLAAAVGAAVNG